ncbi:mammalian cell entry protein [Mycobacterium sp.]|uniref:mammalian cell entry protein n=1 Tax=Mycobacterium sp. TaxID=1785 RepID=UPI003C7654A7
MEDKQPAAGDLIDDTEPDPKATEATEAVKTEAGEGDGTASAATSSETEATAEDAEVDSEKDAEASETAEAGGAPKRIKKRRLAGKRLGIAVAVAAVLFIGSAAFAGATVQPYLADRANTATKLRVARTADRAITTLWTYTPENMDGLADRAATYLSGDFAAQYRKFVDAIVAPNKQAQVTNTTQVTGVGIESLDDPNAVVIVYTNTTSTSPLTKNIPSLKYLSYRLFMKRAEGRWLVTRMTTITSLDLTPHI